MVPIGPRVVQNVHEPDGAGHVFDHLHHEYAIVAQIAPLELGDLQDKLGIICVLGAR